MRSGTCTAFFETLSKLSLKLFRKIQENSDTHAKQQAESKSNPEQLYNANV